MATTVTVNGVTTARPGSYSAVNANGLSTVGLGANGIVAVLGTSEGGIPITAITKPGDVPSYTRVESMRAAFRSGDLLEVADMLFSPSNDADITAGAQKVFAVKVNSALSAGADLPNANGVALHVTSDDYGAFTNQVNVSIANGTDKGKLVTINLEDQTEADDNVGGDTIFSLQYTGGATGYTTMVAAVSATGIQCTGTRTAAGGSNVVTTPLASPGLVQIVSTNAGDIGQKVTIYGTDAATGLVAQKETLTLNGTTVVTSAKQYTDVLGMSIVGVTAGSVKVEDTGAVVILTATADTNAVAAAIMNDYTYVDNATVQLVASASSTAAVLVFGKSTTGADQSEKISLNGTSPVTTTLQYSQITVLAVANVTHTTNVTMTALAAYARVAVQSTMQKAVDYFNARQAVIAGPSTRGFIATLVSTKPTQLLSELDYTVSNLDIASGAQNLTADIMAIVNYLNVNSLLVHATRGAALGGAPTNTTSPVFLAGGSEGTSDFANWQAGLDILKQLNVQTVVPLTADPAVAAAVEAHCAFMCGQGRNERDCFIGLMNDDQTDVPTKSEIKAQIQALNSRHVRAVAETCTRFNAAGIQTEYNPYFYAAVAAGMQSGAPVGTSLTAKFPSVLATRKSNTWNDVDDGDEMIQAGLLFSENVDGVGIRWVRNITTYLQDNNLAFIEGSVNQAVNFAVKSFRTAMEASVGKRGFAGTVNAAKTVALGILGQLSDGTNPVITAWQALSVVLQGDQLVVSVQISPVIPINFVTTTIYLAANTIAAT